MQLKKLYIVHAVQFENQDTCSIYHVEKLYTVYDRKGQRNYTYSRYRYIRNTGCDSIHTPGIGKEMVHTPNASRQIVFTPDTGKEIIQLHAIGIEMIYMADVQQVEKLDMFSPDTGREILHIKYTGIEAMHTQDSGTAIIHSQ